MSQTLKKAPVDWEALRPHYQAGITPLRELGKEFGCSDAAIVKHAAKAGWARDLQGKIKAKADAQVSAAAVSKQVSKRGKAAEAAVVDANATLQATIRLSHRKRVGKAAAIVDGLFQELEDAAKPSVDNGMGLFERTKVAKALAESLKILVGIEREAYNIVVEADAEDQPRSRVVYIPSKDPQ